MANSELQLLIQGSGLSDEDKKMWEEALSMLDDDESRSLLDVFSEDVSQLPWFTDNLRSKKEAIMSGDKSILNKILDGEREMLNKLSQ